VSFSVEGLCVDLGRRRILDKVDVRVPNGSIVGLLGPNGSGKSTLLKTMYRVHRPSSGRVLIDGDDLLALPARRAAQRVAVLAQDSTVEFDFTVREVVAAGRTPHRGLLERDRPEDSKAIDEALLLVGCAELEARIFTTLSGGERQRVLLARALAQGADHLLLDEPTNHLDIRYQTMILDLVAELPVTVFAALHDLGIASMYCDEVVLLDRGRVVDCGPPSQVITTSAVHQVYDAHVLVIDHPSSGTPYVLPTRSPKKERTSTS